VGVEACAGSIENSGGLSRHQRMRSSEGVAAAAGKQRQQASYGGNIKTSAIAHQTSKRNEE